MLHRLCKLFQRVQLSNLFMQISMWKTFYIKPNEIGILYRRSDFKKILRPGNYTYFGGHWQVKTHDLNQPEAKIENLELLLRTHEAELQQHLEIVKTTFDRVALVRCGQTWVSVTPNQLRAFWRGFRLSQHHGENRIWCYKTFGGGLRRGLKFIGFLSKSSPRLTHPTTYNIFLSPQRRESRIV
jgi:hypothetical protein